MAPGEVAATLSGITWDLEPPFVKGDFRRFDESDDATFYETPRLVYHIDDDAVAATTAFYDATFRDVARQRGSSKLDVLDLCSSWVSHYPAPAASSWQLGRVAGLGMNAEELQRNERLTEWTVRDLNKDARMPYAAERYVLRLPADR